MRLVSLTRCIRGVGPRISNLKTKRVHRWATQAQTSDERRANVEVLLVCIMRNGWRDHDRAADYDIRMARGLLIEFVGGQQADILADQFASEAVPA